MVLGMKFIGVYTRFFVVLRAAKGACAFLA